MRILSGIWSGIAVVVFLLIVIGGSITLTAMTSTQVSLSSALTDPYLISVIRFTIGQAVLSTTISVGLALVVTRALARRAKFPGRRLLILLMGLPVVMPVIVAIFGITAVFGKNGLLNELLSLFGVEQSFTVYGLTGILVAHTFFNLPLAIRLLLPAWDARSMAAAISVSMTDSGFSKSMGSGTGVTSFVCGFQLTGPNPAGAGLWVKM